MSEITITALLLAMLIAMLSAGVWVAFALIITGVAGMALLSNAPIGPILATTIWGHSHSWALAALPMFILMGEILLRSRLSDDMFSGLSPWLTRLPGRLLHVNIFGCAIFAAVSIILIVYGVATEQSIARLFIAGVIPGALLVFMFAAYVAAVSLANPALIPVESRKFTFSEKVIACRRLIPIFLLIAGVIGSIYLGIASPTDAAAVGVVFSILLSWVNKSLSLRMLKESLMGATITSCMIAFILAGAAFLSVSMGFTGIPRNLASWIGSFELSTIELLAALTVFFIILGCFLDGISVVVLTTSIIMPLVEQSGIDPLWFGIYLVIVVEMSQITPPVGFNLFVIQGLTGIDILRVAKSALPFFLLLLLAIVAITAMPSIVTFLPDLMTKN